MATVGRSQLADKTELSRGRATKGREPAPFPGDRAQRVKAMPPLGGGSPTSTKVRVLSGMVQGANGIFGWWVGEASEVVLSALVGWKIDNHYYGLPIIYDDYRCRVEKQ